MQIPRETQDNQQVFFEDLPLNALEDSAICRIWTHAGYPNCWLNKPPDLNPQPKEWHWLINAEILIKILIVEANVSLVTSCYWSKAWLSQPKWNSSYPATGRRSDFPSERFTGFILLGSLKSCTWLCSDWHTYLYEISGSNQRLNRRGILMDHEKC